jgi:hypothetical protein
VDEGKRWARPQSPQSCYSDRRGRKRGRGAGESAGFYIQYNKSIRFVNIFYGCSAPFQLFLALSRLARYHPALDVFRFSLVIDTLEESAVSCDGGGVVII